jgi:hypothetical protein
MTTQRKCRHGIPYGTRCQTCINRVLFFKKRAAAAVPGSVTVQGAGSADPPAPAGGNNT